MAYIKRDKDGHIQAISLVESKDWPEKMDNEQDVLKFFSSILGVKDTEAIASDLEMARVIEDLIDILVAKSIISFIDLPQPVQLKLLKRKSLRHQGVFNTSNNELINL